MHVIPAKRAHGLPCGAWSKREAIKLTVDADMAAMRESV
jgi:hypothetical protein